MGDFLWAAAEAGNNPVSEWMQAVGSVGAALVPLIFFLVERRDRQEADRQRDEADARREQAEARYREAEAQHREDELARLTAAELAAAKAQDRAQAELIQVWSNQDSGPPRIYCINTSSAPVYDLEVEGTLRFYDPETGRQVPFGSEGARFDGKLLPPTGKEPIVQKLTQLERWWPPSKGRRDNRAYVPPPRPDGLHPSDYQVSHISFRDSKGRQWIKEISTGRLEISTFEPFMLRKVERPRQLADELSQYGERDGDPAAGARSRRGPRLEDFRARDGVRRWPPRE